MQGLMLLLQCSMISNHLSDPLSSRIIKVETTSIANTYRGYHGMISGVYFLAARSVKIPAPQSTTRQITATFIYFTSSHALFFGSVGWARSFSASASPFAYPSASACIGSGSFVAVVSNSTIRVVSVDCIIQNPPLARLFLPLALACG